MTSGDINATIWAGVGDHMVRVDVLKGATTGLTIAHGQDGIDRLDIGIYHQPEGVIGDISLGLVEGVWRVKVDGERHTVANGFARLSRFSASTMLTLQSGLGDDFIAFQAMDSTIAAGGGGDVVAIDPLQAGAAYAIDGGDGADRLVMYLDTAGAGATLDARRAGPTLTVGGASLGASVSSKAIPVWGQVLATGCFRAPGMTM